MGKQTLGTAAPPLHLFSTCSLNTLYLSHDDKNHDNKTRETFCLHERNSLLHAGARYRLRRGSYTCLGRAFAGYDHVTCGLKKPLKDLTKRSAESFRVLMLRAHYLLCQGATHQAPSDVPCPVHSPSPGVLEATRIIISHLVGIIERVCCGAYRRAR